MFIIPQKSVFHLFSQESITLSLESQTEKVASLLVDYKLQLAEAYSSPGLVASSKLVVANLSCAELGTDQPQLFLSNFETNSLRLGFRGRARTEVKRRMEKMTPQNSFGLSASDQQIAKLFIVICYLFSDMAMDNPPCPSRK